MENINELNVNSIYDYLSYGRGHPGEYKLVVIITKKQVIISTQKRNNDDHWNMIVDINKLIYPERHYDENNVSNDIVVFCSIGNDLEVELPENVSETQLQEIKNIISQVNHFEYDYDTYLYMPFYSSDIIRESNEKLKEDLPEDEDEVIIGTPITSKTK